MKNKLDKKHVLQNLSKRERQIIDILYRSQNVTAAEVQEQLPDPPSYSAVRSALRILEEKGYISHKYDGPRYVYNPTISHEKAKHSAIQRLLHTFFNDSVEQAVSAMLINSDIKISGEEYDRIDRLIKQARITEENKNELL